MKRLTLDILRWVVLVLSLLLIVFISVDTFERRPFLQNHAYMTFQFWVCVVFMADFFVELALAGRGMRRGYLKRRWLFLVLSVPWLNVVQWMQWQPGESALYWLRFIPLARATMAMAIVTGYVSRNRVSSMFASYVVVMVAFVYFGSLIFFNAELGVNPMVRNYWNAIWWACMDATTIGCQIQPVTPTGKVVGTVLALMGVMVFPLITVVMTTKVQRYYASAKQKSATK